MKTSENHRFSNIFRGYSNATLGKNDLFTVGYYLNSAAFKGSINLDNFSP